MIPLGFKRGVCRPQLLWKTDFHGPLVRLVTVIPDLLSVSHIAQSTTDLLSVRQIAQSITDLLSVRQIAQSTTDLFSVRQIAQSITDLLSVRQIAQSITVCPVRERADPSTEKRVSMVLCGDFNSTPECGVYQLFTTQFVPEDCIDWKSKDDEAINELSLSHSLLLGSAYGTPAFTNFTAGFSGCLDYIFYQIDQLEITQVVPLPSIEDVTEHTALPSVVFPSDHVALVADLRWKPF
uniref:Endonuclease/exonuclease/phosphatase domain-containing protein n=1 Tax=Timema bartmani TaxID=61472 RepID=A0A7R9F5S2_9NEOP|nr:unnamed protein product [Timema bartmani]